MDGIQAAVLSVKLKQLDVCNLRRRSHALLYDQLLGDTEEVIIPAQGRFNQSVYHIYAVRVKDRDQVLQSMAEKGISCGIHYPIPVHLQEAYRFLGRGKGSYPVAERCAGEFLSLPMFPELTKEQIHAVAEELKLCLSAARPRAGCAR
jgi:dTDP-4-amino-4,6-dideoxygalactose transaminase